MPGTQYVHLLMLHVIAYMLPGTIIGAFIVDYLGPKYTMVNMQLNLVMKILI